jgi:hypothetical protein
MLVQATPRYRRLANGIAWSEQERKATMRTLKLGVLIAVAAVAVAACSSSSSTPAPAAESPALVGSPAPALESPLGEDGTDTLAESAAPIESLAASLPVASPAADAASPAA